MKKHIKYLISLLIIFGLTVNEYTVSSQVNSLKYHQFSSAIPKRKIDYKDCQLRIYNQKTQQLLLKKNLLVPTYHNIQFFLSTKNKISLKLQKQLYKNISLRKALKIFLNKVITSNNLYSNIYIK